MKSVFYSLSLVCAIGCALNIWCVVTTQPSTLHLNVVAAIFCGTCALIILILARLVGD
jgi:hypothetical protein